MLVDAPTGGGRIRRAGRSCGAWARSEGPERTAAVSYLTDSVHLYEEIGWCQNFGLNGDGWLTVRDCRTGDVRALCELERALCEPVPGRAVISR